MATLALLAIRRLPPGICTGDSGGLQLACATLGITHPPGYAGYASLGFLFTLFPGADPAYMVSLASLACGVVTILICILMQVRLGTSAAAASAVGLALTAHPRVWSNMLAPEVYMPTLMFGSAAAYLLARYAKLGRWRDLWLSALLIGVALADRPPIALTLPFFVIAGWWAVKRFSAGFTESVKRMGLAAILVMIPALYSLAYVWTRDRPETPYNYIDQFNAEANVLPSSEAGGAAKIRRIYWLVTGEQFRDKMGSSWAGVIEKLRWMNNELLPARLVSIRLVPYRGLVLAIGLVTIVLAGLIAWRRCRILTLLVTGMALGAIVFVCSYRMFGDAADILPVIFTLATLGGVALSPIFPAFSRGRQRIAAVGLTCMVCGWTIHDARFRHDVGRRLDALPFLYDLDLPTLPKDSIICSHWGTSPPLWYARHVMFDRPDILVVNALESEWSRLTDGLLDRPIFATSQPSPWSGFAASPYRNIWRLMPDSGKR